MRNSGRTITFAVAFCLVVPSLLLAEDPLPSSGELLERMSVASGYREAWTSTQSLLTKTVLNGIGVHQSTTEYCDKSGRSFRITTREDGREFRDVCDGKIGWKIDFEGETRLMSDSEVASWSTFKVPPTRDPEAERNFKVTGTSTVDGVPVYTVTYINPMREETTAYIDIKTSLMLQTKIVRRFDGKDVIEISKMLDYKDFGGMKISTKQMRYTNFLLMTFNVDVERNVDPPAGIFDMPDKVKELLTEKAARATTQPASTQPSGS